MDSNEIRIALALYPGFMKQLTLPIRDNIIAAENRGLNRNCVRDWWDSQTGIRTFSSGRYRGLLKSRAFWEWPFVGIYLRNGYGKTIPIPTTSLM